MSLSLSLKPTLVPSGEYDEMERPTVMQIAIQLLSGEKISERMATKNAVEYAFKIADKIKKVDRERRIRAIQSTTEEACPVSLARHPIYDDLNEWKEGEIREIRKEEKDELLQDGKA